MIGDPATTKVDIDKLLKTMQPKQNLKLFVVSRKATGVKIMRLQFWQWISYMLNVVPDVILLTLQKEK